METKPTDEAGDTGGQNALEPTQESSRLKLRDLRPEKDPMGAGRNRHRKISA
jgi:hypothetical protein